MRVRCRVFSTNRAKGGAFHDPRDVDWSFHAPTQTEPPFALTQAVVLAIFILIALIAAIRFRPGTTVQVLRFAAAECPDLGEEPTSQRSIGMSRIGPMRTSARHSPRMVVTFASLFDLYAHFGNELGPLRALRLDERCELIRGPGHRFEHLRIEKTLAKTWITEDARHLFIDL